MGPAATGEGVKDISSLQQLGALEAKKEALEIQIYAGAAAYIHIIAYSAEKGSYNGAVMTFERLWVPFRSASRWNKIT